MPALLALAGGCWAWLAASALAVGPLTLADALEKAVHQNPRLAAAERAIEAAKARELQAAVVPNPNLMLTVDQVPIPTPIAGNYMAGVSQPLLPPGQREARVALAQVETELAGMARDVVKLELSAQVERAYAGLLHARTALDQARREAEAGRQLLVATEGRFKAGEVARVEALRAEVESSRLARAVAAAESREAQARGRLNVLLGQPAQSELMVAGLPMPDPKALAPVGAYVEAGLARRPELRQAEAAIERESLQRRVAVTSLWTGSEVSLSGGAVGGAPGFSSALSVPIPVYQRQGEIAEAEANRARATAERDALKNTITLEIEEAYRQMAIAAGQVELFRRTYVPQAERLADNARRRFAAGEGSGVEVIEALRALHETRAELAQAVLDYREAATELARASGQVLAASSSQEIPR